ncbi:hypothetical protein MTsPCn9_16520 [Croceitalea sp. MTPC9]|uniref:hypothetical protein n=1 Tax=unclassified Croceitalea TaxID=2632280 RepID=UPI002B3B3F49|nr:hypothetical protein MTsPCn6_09370 [Croceitalea sp. MTPC6]GMN16716.1 hypothetical protein MTsPCn9_16520 [Croceitalea sp. MTPC9]
MKSIMKNTIVLLLLLFVFMFSCSSDDLNNTLPECSEQEQQALVDRSVIATFTDVRGMIVNDDGCPEIFALTGGPMVEGRNVDRLFACNLPDSYKSNGLEVVFSGDLYETFDTENICAQIFLLTRIDTP